MSIMKKIKNMRDNFDKYIVASAYAEAGAPHLAREVLEEKQPERPTVRQRPRLELR